MSKILPPWRKDIEVLYDASTVAERVRELGATITQDYEGEVSHWWGFSRAPLFLTLI
ncbi:MAG: hypothetical protein R3C68_15720 [Myxococcota bacterium]